MSTKPGRPTIRNLDDYVDYVGVMFDRALEKKAVGIKNSFAYMRSLQYEDVPFRVASALFDKGANAVLTEREEKAVQDFLFHWIIRRAAEVDLPIQIHTGYLSGNGNVLENSRPADLNNIFLQYPEVDFILFHGGYPWTSQAVSLTKAFPNVSIDLVWLPQISKEASVEALEEILDMVPYKQDLLGWRLLDHRGNGGISRIGQGGRRVGSCRESGTRRYERGNRARRRAEDLS